jgi:hypothetical protein
MDETNTKADKNTSKPTTGFPGMISTEIVMDSGDGFNMTLTYFYPPFKGVKGG